ncbi:Hypothetical predicted protein [Pelobates cultripes]|uniref:Uncharacterized protein n=1 Tax=Pelobates cultripes TaxID=61616 RepID=A0AAD1SBE5_PELCU|nr:Hypothetical predicted protein [Pelobates cultripes]
MEQITSDHTPRLTTLEKSAQEVEHTKEAQERRLLTELLTPKQAKKVQLEGFFRLPKPARAPATVTRDVVAQFESGCDTAAAKEKCPLNFESMQLTFFDDLSSGTVAWRQSLRPLTTILRTHNIRYRWTLTRTLYVSHGDTQLPVRDITAAEATLRTLGLPQDSLPRAIHAASSHNWDPSSLFIPRRATADLHARSNLEA